MNIEGNLNEKEELLKKCQRDLSNLAQEKMKL